MRVNIRKLLFFIKICEHGEEVDIIPRTLFSPPYLPIIGAKYGFVKSFFQNSDKNKK